LFLSIFSVIAQNRKFILNADKDLLEMMFMNFLTNAIDAIELSDNETGCVKISYKNTYQKNN